MFQFNCSLFVLWKWFWTPHESDRLILISCRLEQHWVRGLGGYKSVAFNANARQNQRKRNQNDPSRLPLQFGRYDNGLDIIIWKWLLPNLSRLHMIFTWSLLYIHNVLTVAIAQNTIIQDFLEILKILIFPQKNLFNCGATKCWWIIDCLEFVAKNPSSLKG